MGNKYLAKSHEISEKFNSLPQDDREKISVYQLSYQLLTIEQLKIKLKRECDRQVRDLTAWEDSILEILKSRE